VTPARPSADPAPAPPAPSPPASTGQVSASASASASVAPSPPETPPPADPKSPAVRAFTSWYGGEIPFAERPAKAVAARSGVVKELYAKAGVTFPPASLLLRAFKSERELEVWASSQKNEPLTHVTTYRICTLSGELGPKRSEGDAQVPEGFYTLDYLWANSAYHLEMKVGYPNASDKVLGGRQPGSAIMIHGACASIGCLAMSDERIEELWVMAAPVIEGGAKVHVHIFPARDFKGLFGDPTRSKHFPFWTNLKEGLDAFERTHKLPVVGVHWDGKYTFK
jgi:hypothetical protein